MAEGEGIGEERVGRAGRILMGPVFRPASMRVELGVFGRLTLGGAAIDGACLDLKVATLFSD